MSKKWKILLISRCSWQGVIHLPKNNEKQPTTGSRKEKEGRRIGSDD
ncbi:hypothetical protein [Salibacterium aidingense]|nr:hypothetical protein [Salibacterium aidingense]